MGVKGLAIITEIFWKPDNFSMFANVCSNSETDIEYEETEK